MLATRQPVLRRFWYPVMPAALVDQGPQPFTLLDERIVLWKDGNGRYAAMADRCPHRSAQLSKGWVDGNALVCPYHGWAYDGSGTCVRVPQRPDSGGLKGTAVETFACTERYGHVWVALDEPLGALDALTRIEMQRLLEQGWEVRGTSRHEQGLALVEAAGIEPALADPQQPGTLLDLVGDVTAVYWLLGSASGEAENIEAVHGPRLERFLERLVETPVRRFVYEAAGSVDPAVLAKGASAVRKAGETWRIPVEVLDHPAGPQIDVSKLG